MSTSHPVTSWQLSCSSAAFLHMRACSLNVLVCTGACQAGSAASGGRHSARLVRSAVVSGGRSFAGGAAGALAARRRGAALYKMPNRMDGGLALAQN